MRIAFILECFIVIEIEGLRMGSVTIETGVFINFG
jgi:hypothetical protein